MNNLNILNLNSAGNNKNAAHTSFSPKHVAPNTNLKMKENQPSLLDPTPTLLAGRKAGGAEQKTI